MVLTKQDLQDWNSHPVTRKILGEIDEAIVTLRAESTLRDTADQTAMQTAYNEGMSKGAEIVKETYEELMEDVE